MIVNVFRLHRLEHLHHGQSTRNGEAMIFRHYPPVAVEHDRSDRSIDLRSEIECAFVESPDGPVGRAGAFREYHEAPALFDVFLEICQ